MPVYEASPRYTEAGAARLGVLLANSGTADTLDARGVRGFLRDLLGDPRTIELPRAFWLPLLYGVILPLRPARSLPKYRRIWTAEGSPLLVHSRALRAALAAELTRRRGGDVPVELGMLYSRPAIRAGLEALREAGAQRIVLLPLFPQYSGTTNAPVLDQAARVLARWRWLPGLVFVPSYHEQRAYLDAVAASIRERCSFEGSDALDHLLFSFHGIPARYAEAGDPYRRQCEQTAAGIAARLGLDAGRWTLSFQSRVGFDRWLEPYTDETVVALARSGKRRIAAVCPGFAVDCLETLEEVELDYGERFRAAGGSELRYVPALNARADHVATLADVIERHAGQLS